MSGNSEVQVIDSPKLKAKAKRYVKEFAEEHGMGELPEVVIVKEHVSPATMGVKGKPCVFISAWFEKEQDPEELQDAVRHEMAHVALGHTDKTAPKASSLSWEQRAIEELQVQQYNSGRLTWADLGELMAMSVAYEGMTFKEAAKRWSDIAREFGMKERDIKKAQNEVKKGLKEEKEFTNWGKY